MARLPGGGRDAVKRDTFVAALVTGGRAPYPLCVADGFAWTPELRAGDVEAVADLLAQHRDRLRRFLVLRCDPRLLARVDPDDVLQEAFLGAHARRDALRDSPLQSPFVWLRSLVMQTLVDAHRRHLGAGVRSAAKEVPLLAPSPSASHSFAGGLAMSQTSPSQAAVRSERSAELFAALEGLCDADREVLLLRHFEELGNDQVASVLGLSRTAASNRYVRALQRLRETLGGASFDG